VLTSELLDIHETHLKYFQCSVETVPYDRVVQLCETVRNEASSSISLSNMDPDTAWYTRMTYLHAEHILMPHSFPDFFSLKLVSNIFHWPLPSVALNPHKPLIYATMKHPDYESVWEAAMVLGPNFMYQKVNPIY
jgi:hypothetical protein